MKREHKKVFKNGIFSHFGLFRWKQCCKCKKDFRREKGFCFYTGPLKRGKWYYLCSTCSPTWDRANELALAGCYIPPKPKYRPPPPPPPTRRR
jgi:hypothetical protein